MNKKIGALCAAGVVSVLSLSACGKLAEPLRDAPVSRHDKSPAIVIDNPDGFSNVAHKCLQGSEGHWVGIYVVYHGDSPYGSVSTILNDPTCPIR